MPDVLGAKRVLTHEERLEVLDRPGIESMTEPVTTVGSRSK
jgi:hypothetical protein